MSSDTVRLVAVAAALVAVLAGAVLLFQWREEGRPELLEARVVTATPSDPVLRDGLRRLASDEPFDVAVALRLSQRGRGEYWLAPGPRLVLAGEEVPHVEAAAWPNEDRLARVFWSTIESDRLGGELDPADPGEQLRYRTFLVQDMGRDLRTAGRLEAHHDDFLAGGGIESPGDAGTLRFYARVEVVRELRDVRAEQAVSSLGTDALWDPRLATVQRPLGDAVPVAPAAGELLLLPGFEVPVEGPAPALTFGGRAATVEELVGARFLTTSWSLAAAAAGLGDRPAPGPGELVPLALVEGRLTRGRRPLAWGADVGPGDVLAAGRHFMVPVADDGDGVLDLDDRVLHSWRRPGRVQTLAEALEGATGVALLADAAR